MEELLDIILQYISSLNNILIYIVLFISAVLENLIPPIPGDTVTAFGAFLVATGQLNYVGVYISTLLGSTIGYIMLFYTGRLLGRDYFMRKDFSFFPAQKILTAEKKFSKLGYLIVLLNRFFPGIRSVISITSGLINLKPLYVIFLSFCSAAAWNLIWIQAGYTIGGNWGTLKQKFRTILSSYNKTAMLIILSFAVIYFCYKIIYFRINKHNQK